MGHVVVHGGCGTWDQDQDAKNAERMLSPDHDAVEAATKSGDTALSPGVLGAIIGGGVAFLALVIVIGAIVFRRIRKKKISSNNEAEVEVAAKLDGSETEASAKDVTIVVHGETVTNNEAEVEVAVKLDGSETEASGKLRRVYC